MQPTGNRILVRRNATEREAGSILLPESAQTKEGAGIIIATGISVSDLHIGEEIIFLESPEINNDIDEEHVIIHKSDVLCVLEREQPNL